MDSIVGEAVKLIGGRVDHCAGKSYEAEQGRGNPERKITHAWVLQKVYHMLCFNAW